MNTKILLVEYDASIGITSCYLSMNKIETRDVTYS